MQTYELYGKAEAWVQNAHVCERGVGRSENGKHARVVRVS